ncbi:hypothetical protein H311_00849, partial [Anncaliia algerae PRA109]
VFHLSEPFFLKIEREKFSLVSNLNISFKDYFENSRMLEWINFLREFRIINYMEGSSGVKEEKYHEHLAIFRDIYFQEEYKLLLLKKEQESIFDTVFKKKYFERANLGILDCHLDKYKRDLKIL